MMKKNLTHRLVQALVVLAGVVLQAFGSTPLLFICSLGFAVMAVLLLVNKPVRML